MLLGWIWVLSGLLAVESADLGLGDAIGLHDQADHRIGHHLIKDEIGQGLSCQLVLCDGVLQFGQRNGQRAGQTRVRSCGMQVQEDRRGPHGRFEPVRGFAKLRTR